MSFSVTKHDFFVEIVVNESHNTIFNDVLDKIVHLTCGREVDYEDDDTEIETFLVCITFNNADSLEIDCGSAETMHSVYTQFRDIVQPYRSDFNLRKRS